MDDFPDCGGVRFEHGGPTPPTCSQRSPIELSKERKYRRLSFNATPLIMNDCPEEQRKGVPTD